MPRFQLNQLPPFGIAGPNGAVTLEPYGNIVFLIIEIGEGGTEVKVYNTNERTILTLPGTQMASPAESVIFSARTDDGAGFITVLQPTV